MGNALARTESPQVKSEEPSFKVPHRSSLPPRIARSNQAPGRCKALKNNNIPGNTTAKSLSLVLQYSAGHVAYARMRVPLKEIFTPHMSTACLGSATWQRHSKRRNLQVSENLKD